MAEHLVVAIDQAFSSSTISIFLALLVAPLLTAGVFALVVRRIQTKQTDDSKPLLFLIFALGLTGSISGFAVGDSRDSAVHAVIPAFLTLAGGMVAYSFDDKNPTRGMVSASALSAFTVALFFGLFFGATLRTQNEDVRKARDACDRLFYDPSLYVSEGAKDRASEQDRWTDCLDQWDWNPPPDAVPD